MTLPQFTSDPAVLVTAARRAEALGLDSVWLFDHLWPLSGGRERPVFEAWTALSHLAAATERVTLGTLVTRSSLRHPALLAKMAATVASIAPGRVVVALGSGDDASRDENEAFGMRYHPGEEHVDQLAGVLEVLSRFWSGERVSFTDRFTSVDALPASPRPARPPLWVGGRSAGVIALAARAADGWNSWGASPERLRTDIRRLRREAGARRVDPSWGGIVLLAASDEEARAKLGSRDPRGYLVGGPGRVGSKLAEVAGAGVGHIIVTLPDAADPNVVELLAGPVSDLARRARE